MISVCMATFNGEKTIERQLKSILNQLSSNDEIIVVDDLSSDQTIKKIESIQNKKNISIKIIKNKYNIGPVKSFEKAMKKSNGDYIFFSDQDDIWSDEKVQTVMKSFKNGAQLVVHDGEVVDKNLETIDVSWNHYNHNNLYPSLFSNIIKNGYTGAMMSITKRLLDEVVPFPHDIPMHDQWIFVVAKINGEKISIIDKRLMQYVRHGDNVTGMKRRKILTMFIDRIILIKDIIKFKISNR